MMAMGRASTASTAGGGPAVGATPNHRRSTMGAARQSLAPGAFAAPAAASKPPPNIDPRPLRSREYMAEMKARVHEYADRTGFAHASYRGITSLDSPTQSIFLSLFRHIFNNAIDPAHAFKLDAKKPEEEVMTILQEYRYPALGDVTKMLLGSASSQQYWPKTLGILDWMVQLSRFASLVAPGPLEREEAHNETKASWVREHAQAADALKSRAKTMPAHEREEWERRLEQASSELRKADPGLEEGADTEAWFYPFLWHCFERFWEGEDAYPDEIARLEERFKKKDDKLRSEVEQLEREREKLEVEYSDLTSRDSPLVKAQQHYDALESDRGKLIEYHESLVKPKIAKLNTTIERLEEGRREQEARLVQLTSQHKALAEQVSSQEMTSEEFERLSNERNALKADRDKLDKDIDEHEKQRCDLEVQTARLQHNLEEKLKAFNPLGAKVGLFPLSVRRTDGIPGEELLDDIDLSIGQSNLLHPGLDLKSDVKRKINSIRLRTEKALKRAVDERVERREKYDDICDRLHQVENQSKEVTSQLEVIRRNIEELNITIDEETKDSNEAQRHKDLQISKIQQTGHKQLIEVESRLLELKAHKRHLITLINEALEKYKDELCAAVEECVGMKSRVGECIEEIGFKFGVEFQDDEEGLEGAEGTS